MQCPELLPHGRWRGVARDAFTGKRFSKTFATWEDAHAWAMARQREIDAAYTANGIDVTRRQRGVPTFAEHVTAWAGRGVPDCAESTARGYRVQAAMLAKRWKTERVSAITKPMIEAYLAEMRDAGMSPSNRTLRLTVLRHAMRAAMDEGYRSDDPTLTIRGPRRREHQARILTEDELALMLACLPGWLAPAALTSHDGGLRIGEIAGLRRRNLDLATGTIRVVDVIDVNNELRAYPKSRKSRIVPVSPRLAAVLAEHVKGCRGGDEPVFRHPRGDGHLQTKRIHRTWRRALEAARLDPEWPTWHDLRHCCATKLARAGVSPYHIQAILGHGDLKTTQRYVDKATLGHPGDGIADAFGGELPSVDKGQADDAA